MGIVFNPTVTPAYSEPSSLSDTALPDTNLLFAQDSARQPPPSPQSSAATSGTIQPNIIIGIVISLVGFIVLISVYCFISKYPCFRRPPGTPANAPRAQPWAHVIYVRTTLDRDLSLHSRYTNRLPWPRPRSRPTFEHVEPRIVVATPSIRTAPPFDHGTFHPPPYGGPSPPPYSPPLQTQHPPQHLHPPQRAILEA